ncbi:hypothetical protein GOP47_0022675 [Adiantum capillus-veneris]|uniref:Diphosphomevalonate decarboxylase n=1 Tax=Adiantum capillus-veneris TaxID=13818 RepID=A0A9D4U5U8_ADICA|nr:hypothetical protein GOP47_0022675 [Adiantum capillus-veneris]
MEAETQGDWVVMVTARAPTNIAVIKYWGKRNQKLILPINSSISITLNPHDLSATTTVVVSPSFTADRLWLNGKEVSIQGDRYQNCLREIRSRATEVTDSKTGRIITKKDWESLHVHIVSKNNFPTAAGLASSAAGFACLVYALAQLMGVQERYKGEISSIARIGSGSACRSLYGGFVEWDMGKDDDGKDSIAIQLADEKHWEDLVVIIAVVSSRQKETSSTSGMQDSVNTSKLLLHRAKEIVPKVMLEMREAIKERDFATFARICCADSNQFHATCLDTSPPIFYMNDTSKRIISMVERWNRAEGTPQAAYTFDAGPNAVLFAPNKAKACELLSRLLFYFPPASDKKISSYVVGDVDMLAFKEVDSCIKPPEVEGTNYTQSFGELDYILCTRPGEGPLVLKDHLVDPSIGLPI